MTTSDRSRWRRAINALCMSTTLTAAPPLNNSTRRLIQRHFWRLNPSATCFLLQFLGRKLIKRACARNPTWLGEARFPSPHADVPLASRGRCPRSALFARRLATSGLNNSFFISVPGPYVANVTVGQGCYNFVASML